MDDFSIWLISNKPQHWDTIRSGLSPHHVGIYDAVENMCWSRMVNSCIASSPSETVILLGDKARPTTNDLGRVLHLINHGYAFVGLHHYRFFAIRKELIRQIGFFDERYSPGGFEDYDFTVRMIENNVAFYVDESVNCLQWPSSFEKDGTYPGYRHWCTKWRHHWGDVPLPKAVERTVAEETYDYDLGPSTGMPFLRGREFCYSSNYGHVAAFLDMDIISTARLRHDRIKLNLGNSTQ